MTKELVLENLEINDKIIKLPNVILDKKVYSEVKKTLEKIGGKWVGGKTQGFVFEEDPTVYIEEIIRGNDLNLKKEYQFYPTPDNIALEMSDWYMDTYKTILEPSAGDGSLLRALFQKVRNIEEKNIDICELMPLNKKKLEKFNVNFMCDNFMDLDINKKYDFIIANPPFSKNQDIEHVMKMYEHLNEGGRIVTIMSTHWVHSNGGKEMKFKKFIEDKYIHLETIEEKAFKKSKTNVKTILLVLIK